MCPECVIVNTQFIIAMAKKNELEIEMEKERTRE